MCTQVHSMITYFFQAKTLVSRKQAIIECIKIEKVPLGRYRLKRRKIRIIIMEQDVPKILKSVRLRIIPQKHYNILENK